MHLYILSITRTIHIMKSVPVRKEKPLIFCSRQFDFAISIANKNS